MNKNELVKRLQVLEGMDNLNEDELKEMNSITAQLSALKAKSDAKSVLEAAQKEAEAENEKKIQEAVNDAVKKEREKFEAENRRPSGDEVTASGSGLEVLFHGVWSEGNKRRCTLNASW